MLQNQTTREPDLKQMLHFIKTLFPIACNFTQENYKNKFKMNVTVILAKFKQKLSKITILQVLFLLLIGAFLYFIVFAL
jgi:hypothetical protein